MDLVATGIKKSTVYVGNGFGVLASSVYAIPSAATSSVIGTGIKKSASAIYAGSEYSVAAAGAAATSLSSFDFNAGESVKKTFCIAGTGIKKSASAIYAGSEYGVAKAGAAATSLSSFDFNAGENVKKTLTSVGYGVGIATLSTIAIPYVVTALGFSAGGVVASSTAASMMSTLGTSGWSIVPVCQSIGATGVISKVTAVGIGATATAVRSKL